MGRVSPFELPAYAPTGDVPADKATWRALVRQARRALIDSWSPADRDHAEAALATAGLHRLRDHAAANNAQTISGMTVAAFEPMRTEPPVGGLTRALHDAGVRVLVPITLRRPVLDWADLADPERRPLGEQVLAGLDFVFVPGLAASQAGVRLGQGGGYYDTVLPRMRERSGGAPAVLVLHDHEVVPQVPADMHDVVVDAILRPATGVCAVPIDQARDVTAWGRA